MKISDAVTRYVAHRKALGMRFGRQERTLHSFARHCSDTDLGNIAPETVLGFIAGTGPVTLNWRTKYDTLHGLYRFLIARGFTTHAPLPRSVPKPSVTFVPHIFSQEELRRMIDASDGCQSSKRILQGFTLRTLLLLLYGAALRLNEALSLTLADVDLGGRTLTVLESKFYKTRLIPIDTDLCNVLSSYVASRKKQRAADDEPLLITSQGKAVPDHLARAAFRRLRILAAIARRDGTRQPPRLHDLRHSAAVHRLVNWYRSGRDVQRLLPRLATFLGHIDVTSTQRYLTLTPELLKEASKRFEDYAMGGRHV